MIVIKELHHHPEAVSRDPEKNGNVDKNVFCMKRFENNMKGKIKGRYHNNCPKPS